MAYFDLDGFKLSFQKVEKSSDQNILLIHGNLASKEWWYPTMEALPTGNMLAYDWRGYGDSRGIQDKTEINFKRFAQDATTLLKEHNFSDVHVVGHSTGGLIAMMAVLEEPGLFKSLTLLDSVGPTGLELELPKPQVLAHFKQMREDRDYCKQVLAATIKDCDVNSPPFEKLFEITWNCDKAMWTGVIEVLSEDIDITEGVKSLRLPTLILHGDQDPVLPLKGSEQLQKLITGSKLKVLKNQGHSMNMENPRGLTDELSQFWSSI